MCAQKLDGKVVSTTIRHSIQQRVHERLQQGLRVPGLAVVLVGADPASEIYVRNKRKACDAVGFHSKAYDLPQATEEAELCELIDKLNQDESIDGILVQLPLPDHINENSIVERIVPHKDVDAFHPYNLGRLAQRRPLLRPCTPFGVIRLLEHYDIPIRGKIATVVGASNIVGRPMTFELLLAGATVTTCHRFTRDLKPFVNSAELLIVATGKQDLVKPEWIKPDAVVVDIGIHRLPSGKLRGDLDHAAVNRTASWLTPVPGGVGPMTIAILLENTLQAAEISHTVP